MPADPVDGLLVLPGSTDEGNSDVGAGVMPGLVEDTVAGDCEGTTLELPEGAAEEGNSDVGTAVEPPIVDEAG